MKRQLFIPQTLSTEGTEISAFADGEIGAVVVGETVSTDCANLGANEQFNIVWQRSDSTISTSPVLQLSWLYQEQTAVYTAGTAQITHVTPTVASTQVYGDEYLLKIIDTTPGTMNLPKKSFSVVHVGVDYTVATLIDAFVALIGTDTDLKVTATDGTTYLILTGTSGDTHFRVALDSNLLGDTVTYGTPAVPSNGANAAVTLLETALLAEGEGITNQVRLPQYYRGATEVEAGVDYDLYTAIFAKPVVTKDAMKNVGVEFYYIITAEDESETAASAHFGYALNAAVPTGDVADAAQLAIDAVQDGRLDALEGA